MVTNKELSYRTIDQLINSVSVDLRGYYSDGVIEIAELIKIATRINYELGLQINQTKEAVLDIDCGKVKMPDDFEFLNFALLCHHHTVTDHLYPEGLVKSELLLATTSTTTHLTSCPCWTVTTTGTVVTTYVDCKGVTQNITFPANFDASGATIPLVTRLCANSINTNIPTSLPIPGCSCYTILVGTGGYRYAIDYCDGTQGTIDLYAGSTTNVCALSLPVYTEVLITPSSTNAYANGNCYQAQTGAYTCTPSVTGTITATSNSTCYNDPNTATYTCDQVIDCGCTPLVETATCASQPDPDPWKQNKVRTMCNGTVGIQIDQVCATQTRHFHHTEPLFLEPSRRASAFCSNEEFRQRWGNIAFLRDKFLEIPVTKSCGHVYLNYQGMLQDDDGNLLVLDHPVINEYYEWAVKERILTNLYINGEPDLERRLQLVERKLEKAKGEAINIAYMPDFKVVVQTYKTMRRFENEKHVAPLSQYFGVHHISAEFNYMVNGRFRS